MNSRLRIDLQLEHLGKNFVRVKADTDTSFTIRAGTFFTLLDPLGCGKTACRGSPQNLNNRTPTG